MTFEHEIDIEQQRALMLQTLRESQKALMIVVDKDGHLVTRFMNTNGLEILGLRDMLEGHIEMLMQEGPQGEPG